MNVVRQLGWMLALAGMLLPCLAGAQLASDTRVRDYRNAWKGGEYVEAARLVDEVVAQYEHYVPQALSEDQSAIYEILGRIDEAIEIQKQLVRYGGELYHRVRLAELLRYRGRLEESREAISAAITYALRDGNLGFSEENWLAFTRLAEMEGENPKELLNARVKSLIDMRPDYVAAYLFAGDVALRNHGYAQAANYYEQALALDSENQAGLAGLAHCYSRSNDPRVEGILKTLAAINPHHPDGRLLRAKELMESKRLDEALTECEKLLAINPHHLEGLGLKAAIQYLRDDLEGLAETTEQSKGFNPASSRLEHLVGRYASYHYRFQEGVEWQRKALAIEPDSRDAKAQLGLDLLRLGNNSEGKRILEEAFEADPYNVQVYNMLEVLDSLETFEVITGEGLDVYLPGQEARLMGNDVRALLEEAMSHYEALYEVTLEKPISVQIFDDHDEFMVRSVGLPGNPGHLGICFGQLVTMDSPRARPPGTMNWESVLWHEFVHCITLQKSKNRMARWLSEGISVYEETRRNPAWGQAMEPDFRRLIDLEALPGLEDFDAFFSRPETPGHLMLGYFFSGELARWYIETFGQEAMNGALESIGAGESTEAALLTASGLEAAAFDQALRDELARRCAPLDALPAVLQIEGAEQLMAMTPWQDRPSPFTDALRSAESAEESGDVAAAAAYLREAHELYPDYRHHDAPLYRLARLYQSHELNAEYRVVLEEIVTWNHLALDGAKELASLQAGADDWDGVLRSTALARAIDPLNLGILAMRKEAYRRLDQPKAALELVEQLIATSPADGLTLELERVELLKVSGRREEARRAAVLILENYPHFSAAQDALLELVAASEAR